MQTTVSPGTRRDERELRDAHFAMRLSLIVGLAMLMALTDLCEARSRQPDFRLDC